jgi:flagellar basal-body rod protein FlgB
MVWQLFQDGTTELLAHCLTWRSRRQEVIAGNLANLDTPGFTGREYPFQEVLRAHLQGADTVRLAASHPTHLRERAGAGPGWTRDTGQPVDLDQEMVRLSDNHLNFQAAVQLLNRKLEGWRTVLEGGK